MPGKILIIEDDPYVRRFYERLFKDSTYEVSIATGGLDGLAMANKLHPDLLFVDILMPEMDGLTVLKRLKEDPTTSDINVIMLTNIDDRTTIDQAIKLGAGGFFVKSSVTPESFKKAIDDYISAKGV